MDMEARGHREHPEALRLWLRFDLMAQLERNPDGLKMNELSRRMMVTGGNVTGITDQLVAEGLVERMDVEGDRRAYRVRLTPRGRKTFDEMARQHEGWIVQAFGGLSPREIDTLHKLLGKVKQHQTDLNQEMENA
jgi:DNA-binding MarR family transcriptional regulator